MRHRQFVTVNDVARLAGVSQAAVSRAFTPGASISAEKKERIILAAAELGYHPNQLARSLIRGKSNIVGVGVGDLNNPFFNQTLQLLSTELDQIGLKLLLFPAHAVTAEEPSISEILNYRLDALVLLSVSLTSRLAEECGKAQVPIVLYNRTTLRDDASSVTGDNALGARTMAAHLLAGGHERLAYIAGAEGASTNIERESAFFAAIRAAGLTEPRLERGNFDMAETAAATRRLLASKERPDAIFCANDLMAIAAINVARHEFGLEVGREISIAGYDDVPMSSWPAFSLTTYAQATPDMVRNTVRIVCALRGDATHHERVVVQGAMRVRGSTRPVRLPIYPAA
ncbi:LacI family DNA-binding transcriptional regulator [Novosphingobium flavum]|uniref:LacI family DNA-binding transcriptional regulator n=1 Tax=Novosphingobium flavum TaxID=1778672 RepID=A0A7X1FQZ5_9SPHN|nr:LacI family DNA-binding transcriptional regulator [Novosphingobium flavum]MBC2665359.1 LacI family DNA-binding transcriptional regulator [Novosphingobium flavum]